MAVVQPIYTHNLGHYKYFDYEGNIRLSFCYISVTFTVTIVLCLVEASI